MSKDSAIGPSFGMPGIDGFNAVQKLFGAGIIFGVDSVIDEQQEAGDVVTVALEGGVDRSNHQGVVARCIGLSETAVKVRIVGQLLEAFSESLGGQRKVMLIE